MRLTTTQIAVALRSLRAGSGLTPSKAVMAPSLMKAFNLEGPVDLIEFLKTNLIAEGQSREIQAARNALALGYAARSNLTARRQWFLEDTHATDIRTVTRWEEAGFEELAHILERLQPVDEPLGENESDALLQRLEALERENLALRIKTAQLADCLSKVIVDALQYQGELMHSAFHGFKDEAEFLKSSKRFYSFADRAEQGLRAIVPNIQFLSEQDLQTSYSKLGRADPE